MNQYIFNKISQKLSINNVNYLWQLYPFKKTIDLASNLASKYVEIEFNTISQNKNIIYYDLSDPLSLQMCNMITLPPSILSMKKWYCIEIFDSKLVEFPPQLCKMSSLKIIRINRETSGKTNKIKNKDKNKMQLIRHIPDLSNLVNLSHIEITNYKIKDISPLMILYTLKRLDCDHNLIEEIPGSISNLKLLQCILLNDNRIKYIPNNITELKNLHTLFLHNNNIDKSNISDSIHLFIEENNIAFSY